MVQEVKCGKCGFKIHPDGLASIVYKCPRCEFAATPAGHIREVDRRIDAAAQKRTGGEA